MTSPHKNAGYTSAKTGTKSTKMYLFVTFSFTVSGCNIIRATKFGVQKKQTLNFGLKFWLSEVNFFDNITYLPRNTYF